MTDTSTSSWWLNEQLVVPFVKTPKILKEVVDFLLIGSKFSTRPVWPVVVDIWPHGTGHNPHPPITQTIAWVVYQALTTPWGWQTYAETWGGRKFGTY
jgi:hypothetical protein